MPKITGLSMDNPNNNSLCICCELQKIDIKCRNGVDILGASITPETYLKMSSVQGIETLGKGEQGRKDERLGRETGKKLSLKQRHIIFGARVTQCFEKGKQEDTFVYSVKTYFFHKPLQFHRQSLVNVIVLIRHILQPFEGKNIKNVSDDNVLLLTHCEQATELKTKEIPEVLPPVQLQNNNFSNTTDRQTKTSICKKICRRTKKKEIALGQR